MVGTTIHTIDNHRACRRNLIPPHLFRRGKMATNGPRRELSLPGIQPVQVKTFANTKLPDKSNASNSVNRIDPTGSNGPRQSEVTWTVDNILHMNLQGTPDADPQILTNWILKNSPSNSNYHRTGGQSIGQIFLDAAKTYKVNVYYLVAHAAHETGWGGSRIARDKHNYFGIAAYDSSPYSSAYGYGGVKNGVHAGAEWIAKNYIWSEKYKQNTLWKMQNDPTVPFGKKGHNYATDYEKGHPLARREDNTSDPLSWGQKIARIILNSPMNPASASYEGFLAGETPLGRIGVGPAVTYQPIYEGRKIQGPGGRYDGEVFEGISGVYDKPNIMPPHYYDDDFKNLRHRYLQGNYFMRIGDTRFVVPPTQIRVSEETKMNKFQSIRQKQSMKVSMGNKMKTVEMTLMFTNYNEINGYEVEGPDNDTYYMDGLRSLLAQIKTMPFLPVENEFLNFAHDIYAIAVLACHVSVVEGFPGVLKAELTAIEFDAEPFLNKPTWMYDSHFV